LGNKTSAIVDCLGFVELKTSLQVNVTPFDGFKYIKLKEGISDKLGRIYVFVRRGVDQFI